MNRKKTGQRKMERIEIAVPEELSGKRADAAVSELLGDEYPENSSLFTRSYVQKLMEDGLVTGDGKQLKKSDRVTAGSVITLDLPDPEPVDAQPEDIPLDIVYEDDDLIVVDKPKGMVVHPAVGNPSGTLVNALLWHCRGDLSGINGARRPGIVHRIDKDTSGLLVAAKNDAAHIGLSEQIAAHTVTRKYYAVVYGRLPQDSGIIDAPIGRSQKDRKKFAVTEKNSKSAVTEYRVLEEIGNFSFLELKLRTGRTHQIRVHMASIGHPLAGDPVYGPQKVIKELCGQCLHAGVLGFIHPTTKEYMEFSSELPHYFKAFLDKLRRSENV